MVGDIKTSLSQYFTKVVKHAYSLIVGAVGGVLGLISLVNDSTNTPGQQQVGSIVHPSPFIPLWIWLPLLLGGLLLAQFLAFHDVRKARDAAYDERDAERAAFRATPVPESHRDELKKLARFVSAMVNEQGVVQIADPDYEGCFNAHFPSQASTVNELNELREFSIHKVERFRNRIYSEAASLGIKPPLMAPWPIVKAVEGYVLRRCDDGSLGYEPEATLDWRSVPFGDEDVLESCSTLGTSETLFVISKDDIPDELERLNETYRRRLMIERLVFLAQEWPETFALGGRNAGWQALREPLLRDLSTFARQHVFFRADSCPLCPPPPVSVRSE